MIPVTLLTGFLGSGKTTLLRRLLADPAMQKTAVIINEFGAVALDHDLVEASEDSVVEVSNGCLCCRVSSDLVATLAMLAQRRAAGAVPAFVRVVIETSGLADPAPILHALATDRHLSDDYRVDAVVTTVDCIAGMATLDRFAEARRQVAVADRIVLTKTDLASGSIAALTERLATLNPIAPVVPPPGDSGPLEELLTPPRRVPGLTVDSISEGRSTTARLHHRQVTQGLCAVAVTRDTSMRAVTLPLFLSALAGNCGRALLRMKGIIAIAECPGRPAVIHGVQHVYHAPEFLDAWPSSDRRTRIVLIGERLRASWVHALIDLLDEEVASEERRVRAVASRHDRGDRPDHRRQEAGS